MTRPSYACLNDFVLHSSIHWESNTGKVQSKGTLVETEYDNIEAYSEPCQISEMERYAKTISSCYLFSQNAPS